MSSPWSQMKSDARMPRSMSSELMKDEPFKERFRCIAYRPRKCWTIGGCWVLVRKKDGLLWFCIDFRQCIFRRCWMGLEAGHPTLPVGSMGVYHGVQCPSNGAGLRKKDGSLSKEEEHLVCI